jgi:regulator of sigma E protease
MSYVLAFAGFAALILLHEAGHFAAAKAVGMRVERFSLFFGPLLVKVRRGETEYGIGPIPLGGYVKISGMNPREELPPEVASRAYFRQPVWKRIVVISAGPAVNIVLAFLILWVLYMAVGTHEARPVVGREGLRAPAATVLRPGDRLLSADGRRGGPETIRAVLGSHRCAGRLTQGCRARTPVTLRVRRDGRIVTLRARPRYDASQGRMLLGFAFQVVDRPAGPARSAELSVDQMWTIGSLTVQAIARIFDAEQRKQISGVVGNYKVTQEVIAFDWVRATALLAFISLSLGVVNLFPFLPLDGGHIFWALAEKIRGRAIPFSVLERASFVGFALVIMLFAVGLTNDIGRLTGQGFNVR